MKQKRETDHHKEDGSVTVSLLFDLKLLIIWYITFVRTFLENLCNLKTKTHRYYFYKLKVDLVIPDTKSFTVISFETTSTYFLFLTVVFPRL